jgi:peptide/nickel transport system permease protein
LGVISRAEDREHDPARPHSLVPHLKKTLKFTDGSIYAAIGIVLGALSGYYGRWEDSVTMRIADVVLSFSSLIIIITVVSILGPSIYNVMLVIGLLGRPPIARIVRGQFLSLREREFVMASHPVGASNRRIIFRHILPNALAPVIRICRDD